MSNSEDNIEAERKFWGIPEVVEKLLPFLDVKSILQLAHCHQLTLNILQRRVIWEKLIKRVCPDGTKLLPHCATKTLDTWKRLAPERLSLTYLVDIFKMMKEPSRGACIRALLGLACQRFPPNRKDEPSRRHWNNNMPAHMPDQIDLNYLHGPELVQVTFPDQLTHKVSPLGYLLMEETEEAFGSREHKIEGIVIDFFEEPWLTILGLQKEMPLSKFDTYILGCNNKKTAEVIASVIQGCPDPHIHQLEVLGDISAGGWKRLAKALQARPGVVARIKSSIASMHIGRREDLRDVWESLGPDGLWEIYSNCKSACCSFFRSDGEVAWRRLLDNLTDMECWTCGCGGLKPIFAS